MHPPSTELALKVFDANAALSVALAEFQKGPPEGTIIAEARRAAAHGFSWFSLPLKPNFVDLFEVRLRHASGAEISAEGESVTALLAGLLGYPLALEIGVIATAEADAAIDAATEALLALSTPPRAQAATESLAAATGGAIVEEEPDEAERLRLAVTLTDEQKAVCVNMIRALTVDERKSFTIAFRHSFNVPREVRAIVPLIAEVKHMEFCDRWGIENAGGVAP